MIEKNHLVFVYGTLKRGFGNHWHLENDSSEYVGDGHTREGYRMFSVGFPVLIADAEGHQVTGELFRVDDTVLKQLDRLEGEGRMYNRLNIPVHTNGSEVVAQAYIGNEEFWAFEGDEEVKPTDDGKLEFRRR